MFYLILVARHLADECQMYWKSGDSGEWIK